MPITVVFKASLWLLWDVRWLPAWFAPLLPTAGQLCYSISCLHGLYPGTQSLRSAMVKEHHFPIVETPYCIGGSIKATTIAVKEQHWHAYNKTFLPNNYTWPLKQRSTEGHRMPISSLWSSHPGFFSQTRCFIGNVTHTDFLDIWYAGVHPIHVPTVENSESAHVKTGWNALIRPVLFKWEEWA